mgnify:CR=1 FL=1
MILCGEKNGPKTGMKLNIVVSDADDQNTLANNGTIVSLTQPEGNHTPTIDIPVLV